jgi:hypothetical protein
VSALQKIRSFTQKFDPVAKWAGKTSDRLNLTPSAMYPPDPEPAPIVRPVTEAGKAKLTQPAPEPTGASRRRRASAVLTKRGLLGG